MGSVSQSAVVVGGGVVGSAAAYCLAGAGCAVTLVDNQDTGFATAAGAGIISPGTSTRPPAAFYPLAFAAAAYYSQLVAELGADGVEETGFETPGLIFVATSHAEADRLDEIQRLVEARKAAGVTMIGEISRLGESETRSLFPPIAAGTTAVHTTGGSRVNGRVFLAALREGLRRRGGTIIRGRGLVRAEKATGRWSVEAGGRHLGADVVICATGAWTYAWDGDGSIPVPVRPQRGQILHLDVPSVSTRDWPVVVGFSPYYMLTFGENRVVVGATRENGTGFDYRVTVSGQAELLAEALRIAPGLSTASVAETRIGFRPASPDGLPIFGPAPGSPNGFVATGLGASGLTLGPYVGSLIAAMARGETPPIGVSAFSLGRFSRS
jgi:D-amino-acid dehydrogenase